MNIAIIGDDEAGKATFLVLLYAAHIKYSENEASGFRFYINPKSIKAVSSEYSRMQSGDWPTEKLIDDTNEVSFLIGRTDDSGRKGFLRFFKKPKEPKTVHLTFSLYDFADNDLSNLINNNKMSFFNLPDKVESLLSSRILIIIIDTSKFTHQKPKQKSEEEKDLDQYFSNTLTNISRYNRKLLYPVFVFTKFDTINRKVLQNLRLPKRPPGLQFIKKRSIYGNRILTTFFPNTLKQVWESKLINYEDGMCFFSSVNTVKSSNDLP